MMAILMAVILTATVILDYLWDVYIVKSLKEKTHKWLKVVIVACLITLGWVLAIAQFQKDRQSDKDMEYMKQQLQFANVSLTNATEAIRGTADGGDSYAVPFLSFRSNAADVLLDIRGVYPLRSTTIEVVRSARKEISLADIDRFGRSHQDESDWKTFRTELGAISIYSYHPTEAAFSVPLVPYKTRDLTVTVSCLNGFTSKSYSLRYDTNECLWKIDSASSVYHAGPSGVGIIADKNVTPSGTRKITNGVVVYTFEHSY